MSCGEPKSFPYFFYLKKKAIELQYLIALISFPFFSPDLPCKFVQPYKIQNQGCYPDQKMVYCSLLEYKRIQEVDKIQGNDKYLLVDASVLPEVFVKVVQAKRLLAQGTAKNLSEATKLADISRSAFYKYKDNVFSYENHDARQITTIYAELVDAPGVLSALLLELSENGANILTINQNIPVDGVAPVSISFRTDGLSHSVEELLKPLAALHGIVTVRTVSN